MLEHCALVLNKPYDTTADHILYFHLHIRLSLPASMTLNYIFYQSVFISRTKVFSYRFLFPRFVWIHSTNSHALIFHFHLIDLHISSADATRNPITTNDQTNKQTRNSFVWPKLTPQQLSHSDEGRVLSESRSSVYDSNPSSK